MSICGSDFMTIRCCSRRHPYCHHLCSGRDIIALNGTGSVTYANAASMNTGIINGFRCTDTAVLYNYIYCRVIPGDEFIGAGYCGGHLGRSPEISRYPRCGQDTGNGEIPSE